MKKKTSALAIILAIFCSILLFPLIMISGIGSGLVFSLESVVTPDREEDLYQSFVDNGGMDWVYDLFVSGVEEGMGDGLEAEEVDIELDAKELFPRDQVETMVYDVYHAIIKGEECQFDLSYQKALMETKLMAYYDENAEAEVEAQIKEEYGEEYDTLSESQKQEAIEEATEEARVIYEAEITTMIEEEFGALEEEVSAELNSIYDTPEYQDLKELEAEYGYSLTDRTELCADVRMAGYILLGFTAVLLAVLLLCHLFRPSGFFTAGAFTLIIGGLMMVVATGMQRLLLSLISSEFSAEYSAEEIPGFVMPMIEDVLGWCVTGFDKVGKIGLMAAVILILVGILLLVVRKNKAEAEPASVM